MVLQRPMENGWPECDLSDTERLTIPATALSLPIQKGQPHAILQAFFRDVHEFNEPCTNARGLADEGSWTENNSVYTSNHKGATAVDWNWTDHPVKIKDAGWNGSVIIPGDQVPQMRELLAWYEGMIYWGNDWKSFIDSMHFQMGYNTYGRENFDRVHNFIQRKIRADGYSTYRRGGVPRGGGTAITPSVPANPIKPVAKGGLTAAVLWEIAGQPARMPLSRYEQLLPLVKQMFREANCNTIDRRAMMLAQVFHESGAFFYKREIADGSAYEGRCNDLGNCQSGDGRRFPGRGWIQLTGRAHAAGFSGWMFRNGRAPSPTHFVDNPHLMETDENAMWVTVYYWTVSRPQLNQLADARNIEQASRAINGTNPKTGRANGIEDRIRFYQRALAANEDLLDAPTDDLEELFKMKVPSLSIYSEPGEPDVEVAIMIAAQDAHGPHEEYTEKGALAGNPHDIFLVARVAANKGRYPSEKARKQAQEIIDQIKATHPEYINAALGKA